MSRVKLWTRDFLALSFANCFLFAGFHLLLPTLPIYVSQLGASGAEVGLITGIFGYSAIFIRLFTDVGVKIGKKRCLYLGLLFSIVATIGYLVCQQLNLIIASRVIHGFGFGLSTTFAAALVADVIPAQRRGEGIGYFGLGSTVAMAIAPALGIWLIEDVSADALFLVSIAFSALAMVATYFCSGKPIPDVANEPHTKVHTSIKDRIYEAGTGVPAILTILFGACYGGVNTYIALMAKEAGIGASGLFFIVGTVFIFISRPFGGRLLDRQGAFPVVLSGGILYVIGLVLMMYSRSLGMLLGSSVFYGLGAGLLLPALLTWMLNLVEAQRRSAASATFYNMLDIGTSTGIVGLGAIAGAVGYIAMYKYITFLMIAFVVFACAQRLFFKSKEV